MRVKNAITELQQEIDICGPYGTIMLSYEAAKTLLDALERRSKALARLMAAEKKRKKS